MKTENLSLLMNGQWLAYTSLRNKKICSSYEEAVAWLASQGVIVAKKRLN